MMTRVTRLSSAKALFARRAMNIEQGSRIRNNKGTSVYDIIYSGRERDTSHLEIDLEISPTISPKPSDDRGLLMKSELHTSVAATSNSYNLRRPITVPN